MGGRLHEQGAPTAEVEGLPSNPFPISAWQPFLPPPPHTLLDSTLALYPQLKLGAARGHRTPAQLGMMCRL